MIWWWSVYTTIHCKDVREWHLLFTFPPIFMESLPFQFPSISSRVLSYYLYSHSLPNPNNHRPAAKPVDWPATSMSKLAFVFYASMSNFSLMILLVYCRPCRVKNRRKTRYLPNFLVWRLHPATHLLFPSTIRDKIRHERYMTHGIL